MKATVMTKGFKTFEFKNVVQVTTSFMDYDEDSKKFNQVHIVYLDENNAKKKHVFRLDEVTNCFALDEDKPTSIKQRAKEMIKIATVKDKPTSEFILEFENSKGTPDNQLEQDYMEVISLARGHLQYYESLATKPTIDEAIKVIEDMIKEVVKSSIETNSYSERCSLMAKQIIYDDVLTALKLFKEKKSS